MLLAGCAPWNRPDPLPPELTEAGVQAQLRIPKGQNADLANKLDKLNGRGDQAVLPAPGPGLKPEAAAFSLTDAIVFARKHSPRLQSARAAIERASGQQQATFGPFWPQLTLGTDYGATSSKLGPGAPGPTGFIVPNGIPGTHSYYQETLTLLWTIYDFGRRVGRYQEAVARKKITELQLVRADQTVQFDVAVAYLNILLARASLLVQEEATGRGTPV
ncbi:MAG: TolC family protein [Syntrophobacterales bacterium]